MPTCSAGSAVRGQARGPAGMEDYATALRLVTGPPFSQLRDDGGTWLLEGDRIDHYLSLAVVDVAHLLATSALAAGDTATARAAVDIARLVAPDEESPRLDAAAVDVADGRGARPDRPCGSRFATAPTTGSRRWTSTRVPGRSWPGTATGCQSQLTRGAEPS